MRIIAPPPFPIPDAPLGPAPVPERSTGSAARVWLVRHAEVQADWQKRAYGNLDIPLSEEGEAQTRRMGAAFAGEKLARVTSSSLARALAMGRAIADNTGAELVIDERLREIWRGKWQGLPAEEFRARWNADKQAFLADPWNWKPHEGESDADVFARAWPALIEAVEAARGGAIAITTHYNVMRVLVTRALGLRVHESFAFRNDPARATLLVDAQPGWVIAASNADSPKPASTGPR